MVRQLGVVFGVAVPGALFKALENSKLAELLAAAGARLDASNRAEIRGLLSGSEAAERKVAECAKRSCTRLMARWYCAHWSQWQALWLLF
jgi:hypothetical protein